MPRHIFKRIALRDRVQRGNGLGLRASIVAQPLPLGIKPTDRLETGDHLLCREGRGITRELITLAGGGPYYHAAQAYWEFDDHGRHRTRSLWVVEMVEPTGGLSLPWEEWLATRDDVVDVYRPTAAGYNARRAVDWMLDNIVGQPYGFDVIRRLARQQGAVCRFFHRPNTNPYDTPPLSWVCSTSIACADQYGGGCVAVPMLWPGDVMPTQLARSPLVDYEFTIPTQA